MEKPNLNLPLASSYNQRGVQRDTNAKAGTDQRKINCVYDVVHNSITGGSTLYLVKRPGVTKNVNVFGATSQQPYLVRRQPGTNPDSVGADLTTSVYSVDSNAVKVSNGGANITILSGAGYLPIYVDFTSISAVENVVLQIGNFGGFAGHRTFYSTDAVTWTEITDADYTALLHTGKMEHMDGFAFQLDQKNRINNSDLNSISSWTAGTFITKQIQQDYPIGLAKLGNKIFAFGTQTVEAFYNAGNPSGSPLATIKQLQHTVGMSMPINGLAGGTHYYCVLNDIMYFVGRRGGSKASKNFFACDGYNFTPVSSPFIDGILSEASVYAINPVSYYGRAAVAVVLTAPSAASQRWLMYFPDWKEWFEWTSAVFFPSTDTTYYLGLSANSLGYRLYCIGSYGTLGTGAIDNWQDDGTSYQYATQFKLPSNGNDRKIMASFGVKADTARSANTLLVEASDDDYQSFKTIGTIDLTKPIKAGTRGGSYIDRCIRLSNTNALETRLQSFVATIK